MSDWDRFLDTFFNMKVMAKYAPDIAHGMLVMAFLGRALEQRGFEVVHALTLARRGAALRTLSGGQASIARAGPPRRSGAGGSVVDEPRISRCSRSIRSSSSDAVSAASFRLSSSSAGTLVSYL